MQGFWTRFVQKAADSGVLRRFRAMGLGKHFIWARSVAVVYTQHERFFEATLILLITISFATAALRAKYAQSDTQIHSIESQLENLQIQLQAQEKQRGRYLI